MELQNKQSQTVTVTREEYEAMFHAFGDRIALIDRWRQWLTAMWVGMAATFSLGCLAMLIWTRLGGYDMALVLASGAVTILLEFRMRYKHREKKGGRR